MKKRRFSITEAEAWLIEGALGVIIESLDGIYEDLTEREKIQLSNCKILKMRLENYQWEI